MTNKSIIIRERQDGLCGQGYGRIWRAYGLTPKGLEFALPDTRYDVLYPLDRGHCTYPAKRYPAI